MPDPAPLRSGFAYQDLVAMRAVIDLLRHPDQIDWVQLEADEAGSIDDVRVRYRDNREVRTQVKFAMDAEDAWDWGALLPTAKPRRKSRGKTGSSADQSQELDNEPSARREARPLLIKWCDSLRDVSDNDNITGVILTNRGMTRDVEATLDADRRLVFDRLPESVRARLTERYGDRAPTIASRIRFETEQLGFEAFETSVKSEFAQLANGAKYLDFKDDVRSLGRQQRSRRGPKIIDLDEARRLSRFYEATALPEELAVPSDFVIANRQFDRQLFDQLRGSEASIIVVEGDAGAGKSTYVSDVYRRLRADGVTALRHHFWLSSNDPTPDRVSSERVFGTLMSQLAAVGADLLGDAATQSPEPSRFREWLEAAGRNAAARGECVILLLDGLDHALLDDNRSEANLVLSQALAPCAGVKVLIATRPANYPQALLDRPRVVLTLPRLDRLAMADLLRRNDDAITIVEKPDSWAHDAFDAVVTSLLARTGGLALHARIAIRMLREHDQPIEADDLRFLPQALADGAATFYERNWASLNRSEKLVVHLLTEHRLSWLRFDLQTLLRQTGSSVAESSAAIDGVAHLLDVSTEGAYSLNYSLYSFVKASEEHRQLRNQLREAMSRFLSDPDAPEEWRWEYLPQLQLEMGQQAIVIAGLDRAWFVDAIARGRPPEAVRRITLAAMLWAAKSRDLLGFFSVGINFDYYEDIQDDDAATFLRSAAIRDGLQQSAPRTRLSELSASTLRDVLIELARDGERDIARPFYDELLNRRDDGFQHRNFSNNIFLRDVEPWLESAGALGQDAARVARLVQANIGRPSGSTIAAAFLRNAGRYGHYAAAEIVLAQTSGSSAHRAASEGFATGILKAGGRISQPLRARLDLSASAARFVSAARGDAVAPGIAPESVPGINLDGFANHSRLEWLAVLHDLLADEASRESAVFQRVDAMLVIRPGLRALADRLTHIRDAFAQVAERKIRTVRDFLQAVPSVFTVPADDRRSWQETRSFQALRPATCEFILDCALTQMLEVLTSDDVAALFAAGLDSMELGAALETRPHAANEAAAKSVVERLIRDADESLSSREDRAERYRIGFALARAKGNSAHASLCPEAIGRALLSHGYHKDLFLHEFLESLDELMGANVELGSDIIDSVAAPIAYIHSFTDSDHTRYLPITLGRTLQRLDPDRYPRYHKWLIETEEYFTLKHLLSHQLRTTKSGADAMALLRTVRDRDVLDSATEREPSDALAETATELLSRMRTVTDREGEHASEPLPINVNYPPKLEPIQPVEIEPTRYRMLGRDEWFRVSHADWWRYWLTTDRADEAWAAILSVLRSEHYSFGTDEMYDIALELRGPADGYEVLVGAMSWTRWTDVGNNEHEEALRLVRENHPERLYAFPFDALAVEMSRVGRFRPHPRLMGRTFVHYLVQTGRVAEAHALALRLGDLGRELTSAWRFPTPAWLSDR